jgi:2-keto-3-deoxy-L-rhamnonate aldolase RhmA
VSHRATIALDIGAFGVMVPMVETPEQARAIVDCTRYPPAGRRGAAFNVAAHDDYSGGAETDKIAKANARTMVIVLVETAKFHAAVDNLVIACKKHSKTPGFLAGDPKWARDFRAKGFRMMAYGVDTLLMQGALADGIKLLQGTVEK